jgi:hypothetical protein
VIDNTPEVVVEQLKIAARADGLEVHDWPFEGQSDKFYVETEDHRRFSVQVKEFARFQAGNVYF